MEGVKVTGNAYQAVWIIDKESGGRFVGNDLRGNAGGAWKIAKGATVAREGNKE